MLLKSERTHVLSVFDDLDDEVRVQGTLDFVMILYASLFYYKIDFKHIDKDHHFNFSKEAQE